MKRSLLALNIALVLSTPVYAESPEIAELRAEMQRLKTDYENRIRALEERLQSVESAKPAAQEEWYRDVPSTEPRTQGADRSVEGRKTATPTVPSVASGASNLDISLVLNGRYAAFKRDPADYALPGFALVEDAGPGERGFSLNETELFLAANVDPNFYGALAASLKQEGRETKTDLEEAYFQTLTLPHGLTLKGGRFNSRIGYLNEFHPHAHDFIDRPLPYRAMVANADADAGTYADDGVQLRWLAPTELFLELGAEMFRGASFPAGGAAREGKGARSVFAHIGGDVGTEHSWRAGLSQLRTDARARETKNGSATDLFTGDGRLVIADFVWKWAPDGNPKYRHFKFQAEYLRRHESGLFDAGSTGTVLSYRGRQSGWYTQAVYQFVPRWRAGLRYDRLDAVNTGDAVAGSVLDRLGHTPRRWSLMADYAPSEFSRVRLQYNRDHSRAEADNQWYLQYIMSLGAHGAHAY